MKLLISKYKKNVRDLRAELRTKEKVLSGIAMELHDNVTQMLAAAHLTLDMIDKPGIHLTSKELTAKTQQYILESINLVRQLSHTIVVDVPGYSFDLKTEIQNLKSLFPAQTECEIIFGAAGTGKIINQYVSMHVFRIIQELLGNVKKHAGASRVFVQVTAAGGNLDILVSDNGAGFVPGEEYAKKGIGLQNIKQRVRLCDGTIQVHAAPGSGTSVHIILPLHKRPPGLP